MRTTLLATVAALLATGAAVLVSQVPVAHAAPESYCQYYARTGVSQNAENNRRGCGNSGAMWHSDFNNHLTWCRHVSQDEAESHIAVRRQALQRC